MSLTVNEQLKSETRICPRCRYEMTNPFVSRCPRCLENVPMEEPGCSSCIHRKSCPALTSHLKKSH